MPQKKYPSLIPFAILFILMAIGALRYYVKFYIAYEKAIAASVEKSIVFSKFIEAAYPEIYKK